MENIRVVSMLSKGLFQGLVKSFILMLSTLLLVACGGGGGGGSSTPVSDTTAPVITVVGDNPATILQGETYTDAGATATDNTDGNLTGLISVTGSVNTATVGSYTITYSVSDNAGNDATATRTVLVQYLMPLPDTGLTWGANYPSGNNGTCTGETIGEQDCSSGRDSIAVSKTGAGLASFDFTKIDSDGSTLAAGAASWSCVKDNHTGLIWESKTAEAQGGGVHTKNDQFNWYDTNSLTNGGAVGYANDDGAICTGYDVNDSSTFCNTEAFVARVNATGLCGASDWRLPTLHELETIVHFGEATPAIDSNYFPNSGLGFYWSSTSASTDNSINAWRTYFDSGLSDLSARNFSYSVRLVRVAP